MILTVPERRGVCSGLLHLLRLAVSEDGRLHSEKYYRTVTEEFAATRLAFRWRHPVALARVTAGGRKGSGRKQNVKTIASIIRILKSLSRWIC